MPLGRPAVDFLDYLVVEAGLAENTVLAYGRDLRDFLTFCRRNRADKTTDLSPCLVQKYVCEMARGSKNENSARRALVAIRMFLRFAKRQGLVDDDGSEILESPKIWESPMFRDVAKIVAGLVVLLVLVLSVLRPLVRTLVGPEPLRMAVLPRSAAETVATEKLPPPNDPVTAAVTHEQQITQARTLVNQDPKRVAQVVRGWVAKDE